MKKYISIAAFLFFALLIALQPAYPADLSLPKDTPVKVYFSPKGGCTEAIISEIDQTKADILVQPYSFTSAPIAKVLVDAHKRGVKVLAILDRSQRSGKYTSATFLTNAGIPAYIDGSHAITHNKIMIHRQDQDNYGILQFHESRRGKERGESPDNFIKGAGKALSGQLAEASRAFRGLWKVIRPTEIICKK